MMTGNIPFEDNDNRALPAGDPGVQMTHYDPNAETAAEVTNDDFAETMRGQPADTEHADLPLQEHSGVELTDESFRLIGQLQTGAIRDIKAQLDDAQVLYTLSRQPDVADGGGVAKVVPQVAGIGWSKSRVSKYYLVAEQVVESVGRDYIDELVEKETESIKDFEILYLVAQTIKGGEGSMSPYEALSSFYDLNRDQAREKLASVKKKKTKEKAEDDTWGTFEERLPAEVIVDLQEGLARVASSTGLSPLRMWTAIAALLNDADDDNLAQIFRALDKGHAAHIRVLAPDEEHGGEYSFADGSHIRDFIEAAMLGTVDTFAALVKHEKQVPDSEGEAGDVVDAEFNALPSTNPLPDDWPLYLPVGYQGVPFEQVLDVNVSDHPGHADVPSQDVWPAGVTWEAGRDRYRVRALDRGGKRYLVCRARNYLTACAALAQAQAEPGWKPEEDWEPIFGDAADVVYRKTTVDDGLDDDAE